MQLIYKPKLLILLMSALALNGCYKSYLPFGNQGKVGILNNIPTPPHQNQVNVYFPGEYPKDTAYVKVKVFEIVKDNNYLNTGLAGTQYVATYGYLIDGIRKQAQVEGMDAVLITDRAILVSNVGTSSNITTHSSLAAVGIKFRKNLTYLDNYVQYQKILVADSLDQFLFKSYATYEYDLGGNILNKGGDKSKEHQHHYQDLVKKYSYDFLVNDRSEKWRYYKDEFGVTRRRIYSMLNQQIPQDMHVKLHYNSQKQVNKVYLTFPNAYNKPKETVYFTFDEKNRVITFEVEQNRKKAFLGTYQYDDNNRLVSQDIFKIRNGIEKPYLRIINKYFPSNFAFKYKN